MFWMKFGQIVEEAYVYCLSQQTHKKVQGKRYILEFFCDKSYDQYYTGWFKIKFIKIAGCNLAGDRSFCWWNLEMSYRAVIHIGNMFFQKKFKVITQKLTEYIINKKLFSHCLHWIYVHNSASKSQKCTKIWWDILQLSVKRS